MLLTLTRDSKLNNTLILIHVHVKNFTIKDMIQLEFYDIVMVTKIAPNLLAENVMN